MPRVQVWIRWMVDPTFSGRRVLVGIGGGIATYKTAVVVSRLAQLGCQVQVVMTPAAEQFVGLATFAALSGRPVGTTMFAPHQHPLGPHIEFAQGCELLVVAPATADLMAKFAHGVADSLLSTLYLQVQCPVLIAPAMSDAMWSKAAVQRNVEQLRADGVFFEGPESGWLSCRQQGSGRMAEPEAILVRIQELLTK